MGCSVGHSPFLKLLKLSRVPAQGNDGWDILRALKLVRERSAPGSVDAAAADAIEARCLTVSTWFPVVGSTGEAACTST